jgi:hypothetical protein
LDCFFLDDVLDEYISLETAREVYGVVIDPKTLRVDAEATLALRTTLAPPNGTGSVSPANGSMYVHGPTSTQPVAK